MVRTLLAAVLAAFLGTSGAFAKESQVPEGLSMPYLELFAEKLTEVLTENFAEEMTKEEIQEIVEYAMSEISSGSTERLDVNKIREILAMSRSESQTKVKDLLEGTGVARGPGWQDEIVCRPGKWRRPLPVSEDGWYSKREADSVSLIVTTESRPPECKYRDGSPVSGGYSSPIIGGDEQFIIR